MALRVTDLSGTDKMETGVGVGGGMKADVPLWPEARTGDKVVLQGLLNILKGVCR